MSENINQHNNHLRWQIKKVLTKEGRMSGLYAMLFILTFLGIFLLYKIQFGVGHSYPRTPSHSEESILTNN